MKNVGLVLEGGGLRGLYTAGILDAFLQEEINFNYLVGVSAGAIMGVSYLSRQPGRSLEVQLRFTNDKRYMGLKHLLKKGTYFNNDFNYNTIPNKLVPFDYETFFRSKADFKIGAFNCYSGKTEFFSKLSFSTKEEVMQSLIASGSLPFLSKKVEIAGKHYLDGGLAASIPIEQSLADGNEFHVVVLTRDKSYRKQKPKLAPLVNFCYRKTPKVAKALLNRYRHYNRSLEQLEALEQAGQVFVIRPRVKVDCARLEKNPAKLAKLYFDARRDSKHYLPALKEWLKERKIDV